MANRIFQGFAFVNNHILIFFGKLQAVVTTCGRDFTRQRYNLKHISSLLKMPAHFNGIVSGIIYSQTIHLYLPPYPNLLLYYEKTLKLVTCHYFPENKKDDAAHRPILVRPTRFERATCGLGNRCSILLSYGRI